MPTGFTAKIYEGHDDFRSFVLRCARAFGPLIEMRDESLSVEIPSVFEPRQYHAERVEEAKVALAELEALTPAEVQERADLEHAQDVLRTAQCNRTRAERRSRYEAMIRDIEAWIPPTPTHVELKAFMLSQLKESLAFDCSPLSEPTPISGARWQAEQLAKLHADVAYHTEHHAAEVLRAETSTRWVAALRASLPEAPKPAEPKP